MRRFIIPLAMFLGIGAFAGAAHADNRFDGRNDGRYDRRPDVRPDVRVSPAGPVYRPAPIVPVYARTRGHWERRHGRWVWIANFRAGHAFYR